MEAAIEAAKTCPAAGSLADRRDASRVLPCDVRGRTAARPPRATVPRTRGRPPARVRVVRGVLPSYGRRGPCAVGRKRPQPRAARPRPQGRRRPPTSSRLAAACVIAGACLVACGCGGASAESEGASCSATIGVNRLPIPAASQVVQFLPDGRARGVSGVVLRSLPVSATAGLPARQSARVQSAVARIQGALKNELAITPASAIAEAWSRDGRAVIARLAPGNYLVTLRDGAARKVQLVGTGCWNFADAQFDAHGRAVARAVLAPGD